MPYSGNTYTNVAGATTAVPGNIVQSATWDNIHTDLATALTQVMSQVTSGVSLRNALYMNGSFEIWQRGAGNSAVISVPASTLAYTADRWYLQTGVNQAFTVSAVATLTNPSSLAAAVQRTAAQTGITGMVFAYPLDTEEINRLRGSKVSFSCVVKAGANWSPASGTLTVTLFVGTSAVSKRNATPYATETSAFAIATNLTAGGANTTITGSSSAVIPTNTTSAELQFSWTPVGTAGAADTITIDDCQLEAQLSPTTWTATTYDRIPFTFMLQACQRHYAKSFNYSVAATVSASYANSVQILAVVSNLSVGTTIMYPVRMRATASLTLFNPTNNNSSWQNLDAASSVTSTIDPHVTAGDASIFISAVSVAATGQTIAIQYTASAGI